uniref:Uncharacterized protein n=1 Tax=Arundo donax TaxID=35708 RepID=A0A0A9A6U1_ARUDO
MHNAGASNQTVHIEEKELYLDRGAWQVTTGDLRLT